MKIVEIFKSIQGEGKYIGTATAFLRTAGCNLNCIYCDTKYSWDKHKELSIKNILEKIEKLETRVITITGGEPLLQFEECNELIKNLIEEEKLVILETNGILADKLEVLAKYDIILSISIKTETFIGNEIDYNDTFKMLNTLKNTSYIKVVFTPHDNVEKLQETVSKIRKYNNKIEIFLQPANIDNRFLNYKTFIKNFWLEFLKNRYLYENCRLLPQLHKIIFWNKRRI
ncbi:MAG: 7-carboxy-7-deazaguanine synthase QueE [Thermosulfidibacteraceae bacterium]|jgi:organic radical activating enzyme